MIEFDLILKILIGTGIGFIVWMVKTSMSKLNKMAIDIAVIKSVIDSVHEDHEKIIHLNFKTEKLGFDIHNAHEKIRSLGNDG